MIFEGCGSVTCCGEGLVVALHGVCNPNAARCHLAWCTQSPVLVARCLWPPRMTYMANCPCGKGLIVVLSQLPSLARVLLLPSLTRGSLWPSLMNATSFGILAILALGNVQVVFGVLNVLALKNIHAVQHSHCARFRQCTFHLWHTQCTCLWKCTWPWQCTHRLWCARTSSLAYLLYLTSAYLRHWSLHCAVRSPLHLANNNMIFWLLRGSHTCPSLEFVVLLSLFLAIQSQNDCRVVNIVVVASQSISLLAFHAFTIINVVNPYQS